MRKHMITATAAAVLLASLAGCYQSTQQAKSADEIAQERATLAARKAEENKAHFTAAMASAATVQARIAAKDWEAAADELNRVQRDLERVLGARDVANDVKGHVATLFPTINNLRTQIGTQDAKAVTTADALAKQFQRTTDTLVAMGWLTTGGGAGTGTDIDTKPGADELIDED
jgi:hypothetical protein